MKGKENLYKDIANNVRGPHPEIQDTVYFILERNDKRAEFLYTKNAPCSYIYRSADVFLERLNIYAKEVDIYNTRTKQKINLDKNISEMVQDNDILMIRCSKIIQIIT